MNCKVSNCDREVLAKGLCNAHYQRLRKTGKTDAARAISKVRPGSQNSNWKGGESIERGRMRVRAPLHPHADKNGYVYRYRLVMEKKLGRYLLPTEIVHHKNEDVSDDSPDNLEVKTQSLHIKDHRTKMVRSNIEKHSRVKTADLQAIRERRINGEQLVTIAKDYGVAAGTIAKIANGTRRKDF